MRASPELQHARVLDDQAARLRADCEARARAPAGLRESLGRRLEGLRQAIVRKGREIIQDHWDVGAFDVGFGSLKAFLIYPALYFAGLGWWIPVAEVGPLNTQIWTAGYLLLRREWLSYRGRLTYGHSLKVLEAHRDQVLGRVPADAVSIHRFDCEGHAYTLRIRSNALLHLWERHRQGKQASNVLLQSDLRALVEDPSFLFESTPYRNNRPLYERVLLARILAHPEECDALLARLEPEPEPTDEARALAEQIGEQGTRLAVARVVAAGDHLVAALRASLGTGFSATAMSLRWIHWAYQRQIYRLLAAEDRAAWTLLSARVGGGDEAPAAQELGRLQAASLGWIAAMETFGAAARSARGDLAVRATVSRGIRDARALGLSVRLARFARAVSPTQWRLSSRPEDPIPPPDWTALGALEAELEEAWAGLEASQQGYEGVRGLLAKGDAADAGSLQSASLAQAEFLQRLDDHLRVLHAAHVQQVRADLGRAIQQVWAFYGARRSRRLRREHQRVERIGREYLELEGLYGTPKDHRRIACFQRFHAQAVALSRELRDLDPTAPPPPRVSLGDRLARIRRGSAEAVRRGAALARAVGEFVSILWLVSRRPEAAPQGAEGTPFTRGVDRLFGAWGDAQGLRVEVRGRELLDPPPGPGEVRLLTPAHRHGLTDNVTFAALGLPDYFAFNAVDQLPILPAWLKNRIAQTPGLIAVGGGRGSAVDRALEALAGGRSRNLLIYPEGSVSEGLRATRPVRSGFGTGLVSKLLEAGHAVRITPVTYLDNARFLDLESRSRGDASRRRRVVVSPSLSAEAVARIVTACGGESLGHLVRTAWLESLVTDEELWLGTERVAGLRHRLDAELEGARYWGSIEAAPVTDQLQPVLGAGKVSVADEPFLGRRVRVWRLPDDACDSGGVIPLQNLRDSEHQELILGIRAPAHIYLNLGRRRFDGDVFRPLRVRDKDSIYRGIAIRFVGVPERSLQALRTQLEATIGRERRTLTCSHSACKLIARAANLRIDDHGELRPMLPSHVLPTRTIRKLIQRGVLDHAGRRVAVQVYKAEDRSLEEILDEMAMGERKIMRDHVDLATAGASKWIRQRFTRREP